MKKADVVQLGIVLIGILYGFMALQHLISSLYDVFLWGFSGGYGASYLTPGISVLALIGLQLLASWILIINAGSLAQFLQRRSQLGTGFKIISIPADLLYIVLICIGIYLLIISLGPVIEGILAGFQARIPRGVQGLFEDERPVQWLKLFINAILPLVLLMFARPIADYFAKNIKDEPISIEESIENPGQQESTES